MRLPNRVLLHINHRRIGVKNNESHSFPCKVLTGHSVQGGIRPPELDTGGGLCSGWPTDKESELNNCAFSFPPFLL